MTETSPALPGSHNDVLQMQNAALVAGVKKRMSPLGMALADLVETVRLWRLGVMLGVLDIRLRYRGSALGPLWMTVTSALMVASMGIIYSTLFHMKLGAYLPFLALSLMLWQAGLSSLISESCECFVSAEESIRSVRQPFLLQAVRMLTRNAVVFGLNLIVPFVVFVIFGRWPGFDAVLALPGLLLWMLDGVAACMLLGSLCARFRDVPPIIGSLMQIVFYVTPIIWMPQQMGPNSRLLIYNPFYALLEIVRGPLLGTPPALSVWGMAIGSSLVFGLIATVVFVKVRARLVFWI